MSPGYIMTFACFSTTECWWQCTGEEGDSPSILLERCGEYHSILSFSEVKTFTAPEVSRNPPLVRTRIFFENFGILGKHNCTPSKEIEDLGTGNSRSGISLSENQFLLSG